MAATARTSTQATTVAAVLTLALALALVTVGAYSQCTKYPIQQLRSTQYLLHNMELAPVGSATVRCSDKERDCLAKSMLLMRNGLCVLLGSPCTLHDGRPGMVRASLDEWRAAGRLVGECAAQPRCNDTHVLVRRQWRAPASRCAAAGHLACACACQAPPPNPFPKCNCEEGPSLQLAPFGGYECVHTCTGTCSPQSGRPKGSCVFPPLAVHRDAVVRATDIVRRSPILSPLFYHMPNELNKKDVDIVRRSPILSPLFYHMPNELNKKDIDIVRRSPILSPLFYHMPDQLKKKGCVLNDDAPRANVVTRRVHHLISRDADVMPQASSAEQPTF